MFKPILLNFQEDPLLDLAKRGAERRYQMALLQQRQEMQMDEYAASIARDPNFSKDSPYNPYINQKLQETLNEASTLYKTGEISASQFKSYVANRVGNIQLWVQNADQLMKGIDESIAYYKTKGADVSAIKNRAIRKIFMDDKGNWKDGNVLGEEYKSGKLEGIVNKVVQESPDLAFHDTKAIDDWLNTFKTQKENISKSTDKTVGGQTTKVAQASSVLGIAEYSPAWQEIEKSSNGVPIGVRQRMIPIQDIKSNDAVYYSAKADLQRRKREEVQRNKLANNDLTPVKDSDIAVSDDEVSKFVTDYANQKRPYQFTQAEKKADTNITYRTTINTGTPESVDQNIFNATLSGKISPGVFFTEEKPGQYKMKPEWANKLIIGKKKVFDKYTQTEKESDLKAKDVYLYNRGPGNPFGIYIKDEQGGIKKVDSNDADNWTSLFTQLRVDNSWLSTVGGIQPELQKTKKGQKTSFGVSFPQ